jgi:hypothetical protein
MGLFRCAETIHGLHSYLSLVVGDPRRFTCGTLFVKDSLVDADEKSQIFGSFGQTFLKDLSSPSTTLLRLASRDKSGLLSVTNERQREKFKAS